MCVQAVAVFDVCCLASLAWPGLADRGREGPGLGLACARGDGWSREDAGSSLELQPPEIMPSLAHTLTAPRVVARMTDAGCYSITSLGCTALSLGGGMKEGFRSPEILILKAVVQRRESKPEALFAFSCVCLCLQRYVR